MGSDGMVWNAYVVVVAERHEEAEQEARLHELREREDAVLGADEVVRHRRPRNAVRLLLAEHVCTRRINLIT